MTTKVGRRHFSKTQSHQSSFVLFRIRIIQTRYFRRIFLCSRATFIFAKKSTKAPETMTKKQRQNAATRREAEKRGRKLDSTDYEYLTWCEDVGAEPQAIDQIDFAIGDVTQTVAAAIRSSLGHPAPFNVNHIEIGNEYSALSLKIRTFMFIQALLGLLKTLSITIATLRIYSYFHQSDVWASTGRLQYPTIQGTVSEADFMTGLEHNSDIVFAAAYAPLFNHLSSTQWTPNPIRFEYVDCFGCLYTGYYVERMFSLNRGDEKIPSTLPSKTGTLFWGFSSKQTNIIIIKFSYNAPANSVSILTFAINGSSIGGNTSGGGTDISDGSIGGSSGGVLKYGQW
ncbi:hypothetical protein K435DRAFT_930373 [Dendrothele bispora CBS 962.96]|uniref:non-reducing end alpha-L-arabinofuranosidase n=1 Tax=Dendrothele bispora (strain CBS 962.96) TaxID=1314807 RepID=A0A4S8L4V0_DENBC|nr:hypothetical protein K435DRAFT_930373 [Dendrothele bispora CBS 962.96]